MKLPVLLLTACASIVAGANIPANTPSPNNVSVTTGVATGTQFKVLLRYSLPGSPDSVLTRVAGAGISLAHRLPATVVRDSFLLTRPAMAQTVSGQACVQSKRRGQLSNEVCRSWSYTEPDQPPPPPVIDSVIVDTMITQGLLYPESKSAGTSERWTFCMLYRMGNGNVGYVGPRTPECEGYRTALGPDVTAIQQNKLDRDTCTRWTVVPINADNTTLTVTPTNLCSSVAIAQSGSVSGFWVTPPPWSPVSMRAGL